MKLRPLLRSECYVGMPVKGKSFCGRILYGVIIFLEPEFVWVRFDNDTLREGIRYPHELEAYLEKKK